jgi:hypothetical protein
MAVGERRLFRMVWIFALALSVHAQLHNVRVGFFEPRQYEAVSRICRRVCGRR